MLNGEICSVNVNEHSAVKGRASMVWVSFMSSCSLQKWGGSFGSPDTEIAERASYVF